jgi:hypothetical protein
MVDKELLELAAKAAGYEYVNWTDHIDDYDTPHYGQPALYGRNQADAWNPLNDDCDTFHLMVTLSLFGKKIEKRARSLVTELGLSKLQATRRAVVMYAAEIGQRK